MLQTILLIEDNTDIREATAEFLELEGYQVITAENGANGILLARSAMPQLVICDILMRDTDGYAVFESLVKDITTRHIPFIFITAMSENIDRARATEIGICEYLVKHFAAEELVTCIKQLLSGS